MCIIYAVCTAQSMCLYLLYSNQQPDQETILPIRCDRQLTDQLDHHICFTLFGKLIGWLTNFKIPWRQTEETRAELCDWRKGKLVIGGEDSRVTGTAAWPPNSYSELAWRKCSKHIWVHSSSWSLKVRTGYHVHLWYRSNLQHLTLDVWCKSSIFAQYGLLICLLQSSICNIWASNYIWS